MATNLNDLYNAALALPLSDRADLAATLYESVVASQESDRSDPWVEELRRRIEKLESGDADMMSWDEFKQKLASKYANAQNANSP